LGKFVVISMAINNPDESDKRAAELHNSNITSSSEISLSSYKKINECSVCQISFPEAFEENTTPFLVTTQKRPSFTNSPYGVVVCHRCQARYNF
jgi:hypothetical protein